MKSKLKTKVKTKLPLVAAPLIAPKLPHERDESVGSTGGVPSAAVQQAYKDVKRGLQDTSRGAAANLAYEKLKRNVV
jgi:hypothetical protein